MGIILKIYFETQNLEIQSKIFGPFGKSQDGKGEGRRWRRVLRWCNRRGWIHRLFWSRCKISVGTRARRRGGWFYDGKLIYKIINQNDFITDFYTQHTQETSKIYSSFQYIKKNNSGKLNFILAKYTAKVYLSRWGENNIIYKYKETKS